MQVCVGAIAPGQASHLPQAGHGFRQQPFANMLSTSAAGSATELLHDFASARHCLCWAYDSTGLG